MTYRRARGDMLEVCKYCQNKYKVDHNLLQYSTDNRTRGHIKKLKLKTCTSRIRHIFFQPASREIVEQTTGKCSVCNFHQLFQEQAGLSPERQLVRCRLWPLLDQISKRLLSLNAEEDGRW